MRKSRYYVIASKYDRGEETIIEYVAGKFDMFENANTFMLAYNKKYSTHAYIVENSEYIFSAE